MFQYQTQGFYGASNSSNNGANGGAGQGNGNGNSGAGSLSVTPNNRFFGSSNTPSTEQQQQQQQQFYYQPQFNQHLHPQLQGHAHHHHHQQQQQPPTAHLQSDDTDYGPLPTVDLIKTLQTSQLEKRNSSAVLHANQQMIRHPLASAASSAHAHARQSAQFARSSNIMKNQGSLGDMDDGNAMNASAPGSNRNSLSGSNVMSMSQQVEDSAPLLQHQEWAQKESSLTWSMIDLGGMNIRALSFTSSLFTTYAHLTVLYLPHNQLTYLPESIKELQQLLVLDVSFNKIRYLPREIGLLRKLKELWIFENLLESVPWEMFQLKQLQFFGIEGNPLMKLNPFNPTHQPPVMPPIEIIRLGLQDKLQRMYYEHPFTEVLHREGLWSAQEWLRDNMPVEVLVPYQVPKRQWIMSNSYHEEVKNEAYSSDHDVKLMSYNILCDRYATQQQHWYTPSWALQWQYRRERILKEIMECGADVVCLQEVDWGQYEQWFYPKMCEGTNEPPAIATEFQDYQSSAFSSKSGSPDRIYYQGTFYPKSRYRTMSDKNRKGGGVDGCAIFWNREKFKRVYQPLVVEFNQLGLSRSDFDKNDTLFERFCSKDNIALGIVLEFLNSSRRFLVTNVHIHWDPIQTDVKLVQTVLLMEEIQKFLTKYSDDTHDKRTLPTMICGDFNSLPNSLVYQYLSEAGGVKDIGKHIDLQACFNSDSIQGSSDSLSMDSTSERTQGSVSVLQRSVSNSSSPLPPSEKGLPPPQLSRSSNLNTELKRWSSWKESGYGEIAKSDTLKHLFSGSLTSAYSSIDGIPLEDQNIYIPNSSTNPNIYPRPALPFTNHTANFTGVIDYIWCTQEDFQVLGVLGGHFFHSDIDQPDVLRWMLDSQAQHAENISSPTPQDNYEVITVQNSNQQQQQSTLLVAGNVKTVKIPSKTDSVFIPSEAISPSVTVPNQFTEGLRVWSVQQSKSVGFPDPVFPSDHIPVVSILRLNQEDKTAPVTTGKRQKKSGKVNNTAINFKGA